MRIRPENMDHKNLKFGKDFSIQRIIPLLSIALVAFFSQGCYYDVEEELYPGELFCDTTTITYNETIFPILAENCFSCHSATAPSGALITVVENGRLMGAITHSEGYEPMPQNAPKLSDCEIGKIRKWINNGAAEN